MMCVSGAQTEHDLYVDVLRAKGSIMPEACMHARHQAQLPDDWLIWVKRGEEADCTCEQHGPLDLEGKGEQGTKAHSISCWHKYVGVWHSRVELEGWDCLFPRPERKVPAAPMQHVTCQSCQMLIVDR